MQAVIFDWGGTLTPWRTMDHVAAWQAYTSVLHPDDPETAAGVAQALVAAEAAAWARTRDEHRAFTLAEVLSSAGTPVDEVALNAFREYWEPATYTDPEVVPLLAELRGRGLRLGVLSSTNWPAAWHEEVLRRDGVLDLFHGCVWSSDLEWTKPHPEAFLAAMTAIEVDDPTSCVYVGDRPYDDIHGSKSLGMRAVFVPHSPIPANQQVPVDVEPDAVINRLSDLPAVLDRW
jgi:HAD superfamily hydrolase (TIGR01549 family)